MSKSPSPRSPPPASAMADRTATAADGGSGGGDGGGKEASDALTDHGAAVPKMSPEPGSPGQRQRQAAPAAGSAEPDAAVQG